MLAVPPLPEYRPFYAMTVPTIVEQAIINAINKVIFTVYDRHNESIVYLDSIGNETHFMEGDADEIILKPMDAAIVIKKRSVIAVHSHPAKRIEEYKHKSGDLDMTHYTPEQRKFIEQIYIAASASHEDINMCSKLGIRRLYVVSDVPTGMAVYTYAPPVDGFPRVDAGAFSNLPSSIGKAIDGSVIKTLPDMATAVAYGEFMVKREVLKKYGITSWMEIVT